MFHEPGNEVGIFSSDKTRTANVLNCFKNNRSSKTSKFIGEVIFKKYVV